MKKIHIYILTLILSISGISISHLAAADLNSRCDEKKKELSESLESYIKETAKLWSFIGQNMEFAQDDAVGEAMKERVAHQEKIDSKINELKQNDKFHFQPGEGFKKELTDLVSESKEAQSKEANLEDFIQELKVRDEPEKESFNRLMEKFALIEECTKEASEEPQV